MFCRHCGSQLNEGSNFCPNCGTSVIKHQETSSYDTEKAEEPVKEETPAVASENVAAKQPEQPSENDIRSDSVPNEKAEEKPSSDDKKPEEPVKEETSAVASENAAAKQPEPKKEKKPKASENKSSVQKKEKQKKEKVKKTGLKKCIVSAAVLAIIAAVSGTVGFWAGPEYIMPFIYKSIANSSLHSDNERAAVMYRCIEDNDSADKAELYLAEDYLDDEKYNAATALFAKLSYEGYKDAKEQIDESASARCAYLNENSQYGYAASDANIISDTSLSNGIKNDAFIMNAEKYLKNGNLKEAEQAVESIVVSAPYDTDAYNDVIYNCAVQEFDSGEYDTAYDLFSRVSEYNDSDEYIMRSAYYMAEKLYQSEQYTDAIEYYEMASGYSDSNDKMIDCNYNLALYYYDLEDYETAAEYFSKVSGYKDEKSYTKRISEKLKYSGWYIEADMCRNYEAYGDYYEYTAIDGKFSKYEYFSLFIMLKSDQSKSNSVELAVYFQDTDGTSSVQYVTLYQNNFECVSFWYTYPEYVSAIGGFFEVTIVETGEVLGNYYFDYY